VVASPAGLPFCARVWTEQAELGLGAARCGREHRISGIPFPSAARPRGAANLMAQMRRGSIEFCVLALLRDEERYGLDLSRRLAADGLVTSEGTMYPLLARLRQDGLVETSWQESTQGPPRRYCRLTDEGHAALDAFTEQWHEFRDAFGAVTSSGSSPSAVRTDADVASYVNSDCSPQTNPATSGGPASTLTGTRTGIVYGVIGYHGLAKVVLYQSTAGTSTRAHRL